MGRQDINNLESGLVVRQKINQMFIELYALIGSGGGGGGDAYSVKTNVASQFVPLDEKTSVTSNDLLLIEDSEDSFLKKVVKLSNILLIKSDIIGYSSGGTTSVTVDIIDGYDFKKEIANLINFQLDIKKKFCAGVNSNSKGYSMTGQDASNVYLSTITGFNFSDNAVNNISATITVPRYSAVGLNNSDLGLAFGGHAVGNFREIDGIEFATETSVNPSTQLIVANRGNNISGVNTENNAYVCGAGTANFTIERYNFLNETIAYTLSTISSQRICSFGLNSENFGYLAGGTTNLTSIEKLNFTDETVSTLSIILIVGRSTGASINSDEVGLCLGGTSTNTTDIEGILYSNETNYNPSAVLSIGRYGNCGFQSGGIL